MQCGLGASMRCGRPPRRSRSAQWLCRVRRRRAASRSRSAWALRDRRRRGAGKMIRTALEIWRDDVNAKGGLLGRPVELVIYDDQSTPANVPGHLHQADHRRQSRPAARALRHQLRGAGDADHHAAQQDDDQLHGDRHQPALQLRQILLDGAGRPGRRERLLEGLLRDRGAAEAEAADGGNPGGRRRVRAQRRRRRPRRDQEARLQDRLRPELSAAHHRLHADGARGAGGQSRHRL